MKNIRNIREEKKLYFILPEKVAISETSGYEKVAIIVYLYYPDSLEKYLLYIDRIPEEIKVYIVSSNRKLFDPIMQYIQENKNRRIEFIKKINRGRDVSALLVACRKICLEYEYICFVHDKQKKVDVPDAEFELWIENLWGNSLGGEIYIRNLLDLLDTNSKIGVLAPPEPIGVYTNAWYTNAWGKRNFELAVQLAKELELNCDLDIEKSPITFGTVFWAKSAALKKIFERKWRYEDFDDEPLGSETISHAIERIIGYVAQDAGYETGTVMSASYASKLLCYTQKNFSPVYQIFQNDYCFYNVEEFLEKRKSIYNFCSRNKKIYLYGAGKIGKGCLHLLRAGGYEPTGFIVTRITKQNKDIEGVTIKELDSLNNIENMGIIITVNEKLGEEIEKNLKRKNISNYIKYRE